MPIYAGSPKLAPESGRYACRFCGAPTDACDRLSRGECADLLACLGREIASGLEPHDARYPKGPPKDPDGPMCACGRRVRDPIHMAGWAEGPRLQRMSGAHREPAS